MYTFPRFFSPRRCLILFCSLLHACATSEEAVLPTTVQAPQIDVHQQEIDSKMQLSQILTQAGIDVWEHPEFDRLLNLQDQLLSSLEVIHRREEVLAALPTLIPAQGWISSTFGKRTSPFSKIDGVHKGLDIAGNIGTPIYAPADGVVRFANKYGGFGNYMAIVHGYGIVTKYAHCHTLKVRAGQRVKRGELIATIGNTGRSTGSHLHFEVWLNDKAMDPMKFFRHTPLQIAASSLMSP